MKGRRMAKLRSLPVLLAILLAGGCADPGAPDASGAAAKPPVVRYGDDVPKELLPPEKPAGPARETLRSEDPGGKYVGSQWERDKPEFDL